MVDYIMAFTHLRLLLFVILLGHAYPSPFPLPPPSTHLRLLLFFVFLRQRPAPVDAADVNLLQAAEVAAEAQQHVHQDIKSELVASSLHAVGISVNSGINGLANIKEIRAGLGHWGRNGQPIPGSCTWPPP